MAPGRKCFNMASAIQTSGNRAVRALLEQKKAELSDTLNRREGILVDRAAETLEECVLSAAREACRERLHLASRLLDQVMTAIEALNAGDYGWCAECGEKISDARLRAIPWTTRCLQCQALSEATGGCAQPASIVVQTCSAPATTRTRLIAHKGGRNGAVQRSSQTASARKAGRKLQVLKKR